MRWRGLHPNFHGHGLSTPGWWTFVLKGQGPIAAALALNLLWVAIFAWSVNLVVSGLR